MNREEIIEAVNKYIQNENTRGAFLINGPWGVGKTFLYENYLAHNIANLEKRKKGGKTNVYISLYGISSVDDISKQLLTNIVLARFNKDKNNKTIQVIGGIASIISKTVSFSAGPISADFKDTTESVLELLNLIEIKDLVICFDDLERCSIPINNLFGYINNLVEHCNCKVIILADEKNIGKNFANTNVEMKYLSVLAGRKVEIIDAKEYNRSAKNDNTNMQSISVNQLKEMNEVLYSENHFYKDIKEKVIGKTVYYMPKTQDLLEEIIIGKEKKRAYVRDEKYRIFLGQNLGKIVEAFDETQCKNVRIILAWIDTFKSVYEMLNKNYNKMKYYDDILLEILRYSIWSIVSIKENKKFGYDDAFGNAEYVFFKNNEYTRAVRYIFVDKYLSSEYLDENDVSSEYNKAALRFEQREINGLPERLFSKGEAYGELWQWYYLEDEEVKALIDKMIGELKNDEYVYSDYSKIIRVLVYFKRINLFEGDLNEIQKIMLKLIDNDERIQEEPMRQEFESEEELKEYLKWYSEIENKREKKNKEIAKDKIDDENIYNNASSFCEDCVKRKDYYWVHKSFFGYIDLIKLNDLISKSNTEGLYDIIKALNVVYYMENVSDIFPNDNIGLNSLKNNVEKINLQSKGITRRIAYNRLLETIDSIQKKYQK